MQHSPRTGRLSGLLFLATALACEASSGTLPVTTRLDSAVAAGAVADSPAPRPAAPTTPLPAVAADSTAAVPAAVSTRRPRKPAPPLIRGIYLNAYAAGSRNRLNQLLALAGRTEINAFVVDVKDEKGVHYDTKVPLARELAQPGEITIRSLSVLADTLHAHGLHAIARIVVFKDPILSKARPEWSVRTPAGELWVDRAGNTWVSNWEPAVWDYNIAIAREVIEAGFDEVQFDYVRFPEAYRSLPDQVHRGGAGTKTEAIVAFLGRARDVVHSAGGILAADVFGLSPNDARDVNIGQQWEPILGVADHVLPMVYPSHYFPTHLKGVPRPNRMPYETVFNSLGIGMIRARRLEDVGVPPARVIPWLQAFSAPWVDRDFDYGPEQAAAQIRAVYDVGLDDWIFWHPGSRYEQVAAAFAPAAEPRAVDPFEPPESLVAQVDLMDRNGLREIRAAVRRLP